MFHLALQLVLYVTYADCSETHLLFSLPNAVGEMLRVAQCLPFLRQFWQLKGQTYGEGIFIHMLCSLLQLAHNAPATGTLPCPSYSHLQIYDPVYLVHVYSPAVVSIKTPSSDLPTSISQVRLTLRSLSHAPTDLRPSSLQYSCTMSSLPG